MLNVNNYLLTLCKRFIKNSWHYDVFYAIIFVNKHSVRKVLITLSSFVNNLSLVLFDFAFLALATMGIVLIFKTSSTTNFAQGMIGAIGAYYCSYLIAPNGSPYNPDVISITRFIDTPYLIIIPVLAGVLLSFLFGLFIELVIFKHSKYTNVATKQIITMGVVILIGGLIPALFSTKGDSNRVSYPFMNGKSIAFLGAPHEAHKVITLIIAISIIGLLFLSLRFTKWGLGVRSVASNPHVAGLMGVNTLRINALSWGIAGALGALSAITYTAATSLSAFAMVPIQVNAFYASILGGFSTFIGPILGALIFQTLVGFSKPLFSVQIPQFVRFIDNKFIPGFEDRASVFVNYLNNSEKLFVYIIVVIIIIIKPVGLFGKKKAKKI